VTDIMQASSPEACAFDELIRKQAHCQHCRTCALRPLSRLTGGGIDLAVIAAHPAGCEGIFDVGAVVGEHFKGKVPAFSCGRTSARPHCPSDRRDGPLRLPRISSASTRSSIERANTIPPNAIALQFAPSPGSGLPVHYAALPASKISIMNPEHGFKCFAETRCSSRKKVGRKAIRGQVSVDILEMLARKDSRRTN